MASQESVNIAEYILSSLLTCKLKSPSIMLVVCCDNKSVVNSMKSSRNILFVILFLLLYSGWYTPVRVMCLLLTVSNQVTYLKDQVSPFCKVVTLIEGLHISMSPPPLPLVLCLKCKFCRLLRLVELHQILSLLLSHVSVTTSMSSA